MTDTATGVEDPSNFGKESGRRERKLQAMIDHIFVVAWALFETEGFEVVTMEAIATAADVAKGTLYKHFPVKEALIAHRFEQDMRELGAKVRAAVMAKDTCAERLALLLHKEALYLEKMRPYVGPYILYKLDREQMAHRPNSLSPVELVIAAVLGMGQASGEIVSNIAADRMAQYLRSLCLAVMLRWLATPGASLRALNQEMLNLFLSGAANKVQP